VYGLNELIGGHLEVHRAADLGTTITVYLPATADARVSRASP
jgi:signal transduction histidine kinase